MYEVGRTVGEGGESVVLAKSTILKHRMVDQIKREISIMKIVRYPNIVRLHEQGAVQLSNRSYRTLHVLAFSSSKPNLRNLTIHFPLTAQLTNVDFHRVEQRIIDQEVLMECFEGDGNKTPEAEDRSATNYDPTFLLTQLRANLANSSSQRVTQECEGLSDSSTIYIEEATHLPSLDDYTDMWMCIESSIDKFVKGVATKQMVDLVKEDVRRFKAKGYCNLNEDEVSELQNNFTFLARLESTPSHFRERALALAEEIPSQIQCLSQIQATLIEKPNLEEEKMCIMAEIEKEMQVRSLRIQQLDETAEIIAGENAQRAELKEELITRMRDLWHRVNKASKKRRRI